MMQRKYCVVHDSLWNHDDMCDHATLEATNVPEPDPCVFWLVNLVRRMLD